MAGTGRQVYGPLDKLRCPPAPPPVCQSAASLQQQEKGQFVRRVRGSAVIAIVVCLAVAAPVLTGVASAKPPAGTQKSRAFPGTPTVGALFGSATSKKHFCTASVVASPAGDVLLTAAHCITGSAAGFSFAPGFHDGKAPFGRWKVTGAYFDPEWMADQNPTRDFAFLTVAPRPIAGVQTDIQSVTGANVLGAKPSRGETVTVPADPAGEAKPRSPAPRRSTSKAPSRPSTATPTSTAPAARLGWPRPPKG